MTDEQRPEKALSMKTMATHGFGVLTLPVPDWAPLAQTAMSAGLPGGLSASTCCTLHYRASVALVQDARAPWRWAAHGSGVASTMMTLCHLAAPAFVGVHVDAE